MEQLLALDNEELLDLVRRTPKTPTVARLLASAQGDDYVLRDEAWTCYWMNQYRENDSLADVQLRQILDETELTSARSVLGEAARDNRMLPTQIDFLLARLGEEEWATKQLLARKHVNSIKQHRGGMDAPDGDAGDRLQWIVENKVAWAVRELIPLFDKQGLLLFRKRLESEPIFSKRDRHSIRADVKRLLENMRDDVDPPAGS